MQLWVRNDRVITNCHVNGTKILPKMNDYYISASFHNLQLQKIPATPILEIYLFFCQIHKSSYKNIVLAIMHPVYPYQPDQITH